MKRSELLNLTDEEYHGFCYYRGLVRSLPKPPRPRRPDLRLVPTYLDLYREVDRLRGEVARLEAEEKNLQECVIEAWRDIVVLRDAQRDIRQWVQDAAHSKEKADG